MTEEEHEEKLRREKEEETRRENLYKDGKGTSRFWIPPYNGTPDSPA